MKITISSLELKEAVINYFMNSFNLTDSERAKIKVDLINGRGNVTAEVIYTKLSCEEDNESMVQTEDTLEDTQPEPERKPLIESATPKKSVFDVMKED